MKDPEIKLFGKMIALPENGKKALLVVAGGGDNSSMDSGVENSTGSDSDRSVDGGNARMVEDEIDDEKQETASDKVQFSKTF